MIDYKSIGARIRAVRTERKITQEQLAEAVGVGTSHLSHIETGAGNASLDLSEGSNWCHLVFVQMPCPA